MKKVILFVFILLMANTSFAQRYLSKTGSVSFYSDAPLEKIEAKNHQVDCALDTQSGFFVVKILMRSFIFEKALMQEHFNEDYVESDKFPNAFFKGKIVNLKDINFSKPGIYPAVIRGQMTIHGVTMPVKAEGTFTISKNGILARAKFPLKIGDYGISIPDLVTDKIAKEMEISTDIQLKPLK